MSNGNYDIIIIGSGAGGGTLARHLAPTGKSILLLERGGWLKREPENWSTEEVFVNNHRLSANRVPSPHLLVLLFRRVEHRSARLDAGVNLCPRAVCGCSRAQALDNREVIAYTSNV
jgi:choline dehydrogenase-like flavoprotein